MASSMSNSSGTIRINSPEGVFPVVLLDSKLRSVARGYGKLEVQVPAGLYIARCEVGGPSIERIVKLAAGESNTVDFNADELRAMPSAAPVLSSVTRHEFYSYPSAALVNEVLASSTEESGNLVLFASRFEEALKPTFNGARPVAWGSLRLRDSRGNVLVQLPGDSSRSTDDAYKGRAGVAITALPAGGYFLEWPSPDTDTKGVQLQPLWIVKGWTTLIFASAVGDGPTPRRETVSVQMIRYDSRIRVEDGVQDYLNTAAELALASLRSGYRQIDDQPLSQLLHHKFDNPVLGILGTYVMLQESPPNFELLREVLRNLDALVDQHPDVLALRVIAATKWPGEFDATKGLFLNFPPTVHRGLMTVEAWESPVEEVPNLSGNLPERLLGVARLARQRVLPDGPWTAFWHPNREPVQQGMQFITTPDPRILRAPTEGWDTYRASRYLAELVLPKHGILRHDNDRTLQYSLGKVQSLEPLEAEALTAELEAMGLLTEHLDSVRKLRGADALANLPSEQLSWAGLSPQQASAIVKVVANNPMQPNDPSPKLNM